MYVTNDAVADDISEIDREPPNRLGNTITREPSATLFVYVVNDASCDDISERWVDEWCALYVVLSEWNASEKVSVVVSEIMYEGRFVVTFITIRQRFIRLQ